MPVVHVCRNPFPRPLISGPAKGRFVVDEKCKCGARRSEHMDTVAFGHGACPPFSCEKFTFVDFIFASKYQQAKLEATPEGWRR